MRENLFHIHKGFYSPVPNDIDLNETLINRCDWYTLEDRSHALNISREEFDQEPRNMLEFISEQEISKLREPQARFVINNQLESKFLRLTDNIYPHLHKTIEDNNINPAQVAYMCGNLNENTVYDQWCRENNVHNRIEIFSPLGWWDNAQLRYKEYHSSWHSETKAKSFLCFNRRVFDAPHRKSTLYHLHRLGQIKNGLVSSSGYQDPEIAQSLGWNEKIYLKSERKRILDVEATNMNAGEAAFVNTHHLHRITAFSIVTESSYDYDHARQRFYTEKTLRAALYGHPFVIIGAAGANTDLVRLGLEPYNELFDLTTDFVVETDLRVQHQLESVRWDWKPQHMHHELRKKIHHNRKSILKNHYNKRILNSIQRWALNV